jgi:LAGLIDADG endonuclease
VSIGLASPTEFAVAQSERSVEVLRALKTFFGCGVVTVNRRHDNHRQYMWRFGVRRLGDLVAHIIPFFEHYPLMTAKAGDFDSFVKAVRLNGGGCPPQKGRPPNDRFDRSDGQP